jgi:uncharacterized protein with von Willebrand factor type A (vWA) domain
LVEFGDLLAVILAVDPLRVDLEEHLQAVAELVAPSLLEPQRLKNVHRRGSRNETNESARPAAEHSALLNRCSMVSALQRNNAGSRAAPLRSLPDTPVDGEYQQLAQTLDVSRSWQVPACTVHHSDIWLPAQHEAWYAQSWPRPW